MFGQDELSSPHMKRLLKQPNARYLKLKDFSFDEVRLILAAKLKVPVKKLPHRLDETVFDLSGGNPFWVNEICDYLATYGVKEFLSNTTSTNPTRQSLFLTAPFSLGAAEAAAAVAAGQAGDGESEGGEAREARKRQNSHFGATMSLGNEALTEGLASLRLAASNAAGSLTSAFSGGEAAAAAAAQRSPLFDTLDKSNGSNSFREPSAGKEGSSSSLMRLFGGGGKKGKKPKRDQPASSSSRALFSSMYGSSFAAMSEGVEDDSSDGEAAGDDKAGLSGSARSTAGTSELVRSQSAPRPTPIVEVSQTSPTPHRTAPHHTAPHRTTPRPRAILRAHSRRIHSHDFTLPPFAFRCLMFRCRKRHRNRRHVGRSPRQTASGGGRRRLWTGTGISRGPESRLAKAPRRATRGMASTSPPPAAAAALQETAARLWTTARGPAPSWSFWWCAASRNCRWKSRASRGRRPSSGPTSRRIC